MLALFLGTSATALVRGYIDAASLSPSWTQGYLDALNSVRLVKAWLWALLMSPLLFQRSKDEPERKLTVLSLGIVGGLVVVAAGAIWERAAFPGLLNFSTDYRTTSFFWETHVGGAGLDGYLALAFPFALWFVAKARSRWMLAAGVLIMLLATYVALTTFSRGVYLALIVSLGVWALSMARQRSKANTPTRRREVAVGVAFLVVGVAIAWGTFLHGGYRGLLAMILAFAALAHAVPAMRVLHLVPILLSVASGLLVAAVAATLATAVPKGPYFAHAALFGAFGIAAWKNRQQLADATGFVLATLAFALVASAANICWHWGGVSGLVTSAPAACAMAVAAVVSSRTAARIHVERWRIQGWLLAAATAISAIVAVFSGGAFMGDRFAAGRQDFEVRLSHWSRSLDVLSGPVDWTFGKGLGRYPATYFYQLSDAELPGSYSWKEDAGNGYLSLSAARYEAGWGGLFRMSQRVRLAPGSYTLVFQLRSDTDVGIHTEICEKHLLYSENCAVANELVKRGDLGWRKVHLDLDGRDLTGGRWYAPRLAFFSIAVVSNGRNVGFDNFHLIGPSGEELIVNGDFAKGTERWFFTSDRHHLPWHIKNLFLNVLFEQGVLGLLAFVALLAAFFWRIGWGSARQHPLAPALAAAVVGFVVVGLFDSLLDVPRVAWQFYMVLCIGLLMKPALPQGGNSS